jgi:hypothetical protein
MKIQTNCIRERGHNGSSAYYIWKSFYELGYDALFADEYAKDADLVVNVDGAPVVPNIEGKPSILWDCDSFLHPPKTFLTQKFTHIFVGGSPEDITRYPPGTTYLPHAFDDKLHKHMDVPQEYDIVFCGKHSALYKERMELLNNLKLKFNVLDTEAAFGLPYSTALSRGKLIFNKTLGPKNIPIRFFEGMAIGALLENYNDNLDSLAQPHKHYIPYKDYNDLIKQIDFYLSHDKEREALKKRANEHARNFHTYKHRVITMLSYV